MQIGVSGDPGLTSFLSGREGGELIMPSRWQGRLTVGTVRSTPTHNIRAGIGYLLMRMANFEFQSVLAADAKAILEVAIKPGDSLATIAKAQGSTPEIMKKLNPTSTLLRPGQILRFPATRKSLTTRLACYANEGNRYANFKSHHPGLRAWVAALFQ